MQGNFWKSNLLACVDKARKDSKPVEVRLTVELGYLEDFPSVAPELPGLYKEGDLPLSQASNVFDALRSGNDSFGIYRIGTTLYVTADV